MLRFLILNPYSAGKQAGHATVEFDTALAEDVARATAEFERLTKIGGRAAFVDDEQVHELPAQGDVWFRLPMEGG